MEVVVSDTNVFIDLANIGLLSEFCETFTVHTTIYVVEEIANPSVREFIYEMGRTGQITIADIWDELPEALAMQSRNLSDQDCTVLYYAAKHKYKLLTGDRQLRNVAEKVYAIDVAGVIFAIDAIHDSGRLSDTDYARALSRLIETNKRLPMKEIELRINRAKNRKD